MNTKRALGAASAALLIVIIVIFTLAPGAWAASKFRTLHRFTGGKDGGASVAGLIFDAAGNLYGTASGGGVCCGVVFELTPKDDGSWRERVLHHFTGGNDGANPAAGLIFDAAGSLYGTTSGGGAYGRGAAFKLAPNSKGVWIETVLYNFCSRRNCVDGGSPLAGLIFDQAGNLYGTTAGGGARYRGVVFKLTPNENGSWEEDVLLQGGCFHGKDFHAGLIFDQAGNLYGTSASGRVGVASPNNGAVFELTPNGDGSWTENLVYNFIAWHDGKGSLGGLTFDQAGNLYGTTYYSGVSFELTPNQDGTWAESVLHHFGFSRGKNGTRLQAGVIFDQAGNLYGTASQGGNLSECGGTGCGVIFKLRPNADGSWTERVLYRFTDGKDGAYPVAGLISDQAGNLYGTTSGDGTTTFGSVFEITP